MEIILLEKTENLGKLGDLVKVKPGYARNYLMPKGMAILATPANVAIFKEKQAELEKQQAQALAQAQTRAEKINGCSIIISVKAGDEGRLFGSIGARDIVAAAAKNDIEITKEEVRLPMGPIRQTGEQEIVVHLHSDVDAVITINVIPE
uniref:Large ribosomal subunit protein bL9 n=1 Tax=Candidatus Kentrum sp. FM TaxID=2126340 RepID=A0A450SBS3_9GAMM|nr:MAG: large subunit ribosomal protein L9 [Candidatus Kentron sp. FM]VFJ49651.1 MAG: large subunit ribosomal protein L9 [Candidatus Kentron sp. FM]VFK11398.1 MAG: large subunit ribosomal protein L9 [Candidatus Kentron sp. FM]